MNKNEDPNKNAHAYNALEVLGYIIDEMKDPSYDDKPRSLLLMIKHLIIDQGLATYDDFETAGEKEL